MRFSYIPVSRGRNNCRGYSFHKIDDDTAMRLTGTKWQESPKGYAARTVNGHSELLHRYVMSAQPGQIVHHQNGDIQDSRRENLITCKNSFEHKQQHAPRGYYWNKQDKCWQASIRVDSKTIPLGRFRTEVEARAAYEHAAKARQTGTKIQAIRADPCCGEKNSNAKLTQKDVRWIRWAYTDGRYSQTCLAALFGIHYSTIGDIVCKKTWIHIK